MSTTSLKALGLSTSPNPLELPVGSMTEASDVVIRRDDIVESRRGYKIYDSGFGTSSDRAKQLAVYKQRILTHYSNTLAFDSGEVNESGLAIFSNFAGSIIEAQTGLRTKSIEANGNFYFTSSEGIKKISAASASDFTTDTGFITQAGGIKAVDFTAESQYTANNQTGFMDADSAVAYRIVWGTKDKNNNLILGTPSQRAEVFNSLLTILVQDFTRVLSALDSCNVSGSLITDGNYVSTLKLPLSASAVELRTNLISLASKIDNDILYADTVSAPLQIGSVIINNANTATIMFISGNPTNYLAIGSKITLAGFGSGSISSTSIDGNRVVSSLTSNSITFTVTGTQVGDVFTLSSPTIISDTYRSITQPGAPSTPATNAQLVALRTYLSSIIAALQVEPSYVIPALEQADFITPLDVTSNSSVKLTITIPEDVNSNYFVQIYRTAVAPATGSSVLSTDVAPGDEMQQVYEAYPTAAELAALEMVVVDNTPDTFRGANLYTNAQSGEGILQANDIPPFAKDINNFKNVTFYANTRVKHKKILNLLGVSNMLADYNLGTTPKLTITNANGSFNTYSFVRGSSETTTITAVADVANSLDGKYFYINSANNSTEYYVWLKTSVGTDPAIAGKTGIKVQLTTGDSASTVATKLANKLSEYPLDFETSISGSTVTVVNTDVGYTQDASDVNTGFTILVTTQGVGERATQQTSQVNTIADVAGSLAGTYFLISNAFDQIQYYVWYRVSGVGSDPAIANKTGIRVDITTNDTALAVSTATVNKLNELSDFAAELSSPNFVVANTGYGPATATAAGTSGFTISTTQVGALDVLLSDAVSSAQSVDETTRSLVRIINKNRTEGVYAYYLSGASDVPGKFYIEARALNTPAFYILTNNSNTGLSFNPDLSPTLSISSISTGGPSSMLVTTSTPHGLHNLDTVIITASNSDASIDGYHQITYVSSTQFRVAEYVTVAGTTGALIKTSDAVVTENDNKPNRVYYSKLQQPEAVPQSVNYFDVGAKDKAILRIFPLRDTLFVLKEDGLFRISGEVAPFTLSLFDSSCILVAPDSVSVANNTVYAWTTQGLSTITESGVQTISRPIDVDVLRVSSTRYTGFKTATWGMGYDSDNSYIVYTVKNPSDTVATQAYRYSNLTNTWTIFNQSKTCGVVNFTDDKVYLGCSDLNNIEQERKNFTRTDYSDREYTLNLTANNYFGTQLKLLDVSNISVGDVITQEQTVPNYTYNMLLKKLDLDPGNADHNYEATLEAVAGDNIRSKLEALATKLDSDANIVASDFSSTIASKSGSVVSASAANPCVINAPSHGLFSGRVVLISSSNASPSIDGSRVVTVIDANNFSIPVSVITPGTTGSWVTVDNDFRDVKACYNKVIDKLNADAGPAFSNYAEVSDSSTIEAIVTAVNVTTKYVTLNLELPFQVGDIKSYESIVSKFTYAPIHMEDPVSFKHFRELTIMFLSKAFTSAKVRVASDLLPQLLEIPFNGDGNGIFGYTPFGDGFFGGASHPVPFRTYVPRPCQRARYLVIQFEHSTAREQYGVTGMSVAGEPYSIRAYR